MRFFLTKWKPCPARSRRRQEAIGGGRVAGTLLVAPSVPYREELRGVVATQALVAAALIVVTPCDPW